MILGPQPPRPRHHRQHGPNTAPPSAVDLSAAKEMTDEAAELLSKYEGELKLYGLKELSDAAAESLSKHKGNLTFVLWGESGLTSLSDAAAESLSRHEGRLNLPVMKKLSDAAAESLSKKHLNYELIISGESSDEASIATLIGVANITDADREFEMTSGSDHETRDKFTGDFIRFQAVLEYPGIIPLPREQYPSKYDINQAARTGEKIPFDFLLIEGEGGGGGAFFEWGIGSELLTDTEKDEIYESCLSDRLGILISHGYEGA